MSYVTDDDASKKNGQHKIIAAPFKVCAHLPVRSYPLRRQPFLLSVTGRPRPRPGRVGTVPLTKFPVEPGEEDSFFSGRAVSRPSNPPLSRRRCGFRSASPPPPPPRGAPPLSPATFTRYITQHTKHVYLFHPPGVPFYFSLWGRPPQPSLQRAWTPNNPTSPAARPALSHGAAAVAARQAAREGECGISDDFSYGGNFRVEISGPPGFIPGPFHALPGPPLRPRRIWGSRPDSP